MRQADAAAKSGFDNHRRLDIICIRMNFQLDLPVSDAFEAGRQCVIRYAKPTKLDEALALLGEGPWRILAGGTDFYPALGANRSAKTSSTSTAWRRCAESPKPTTHLVIGARTTWTDIIRHPCRRPSTR